MFRAAAHQAAPAEVIARLEAALGLDPVDTLRYADRRQGQHRAARLVKHSRQDGQASAELGDVHVEVKDEVKLDAILLCGDTKAESWIKTLLQDELPAQSYGRLLLSPSAKPPVAVHSRGKVVCACFNVTDVAIRDQLTNPQAPDGSALDSLQAALKCGTNCGSCVPELKKMVRLLSPTIAA